MQENISIEKLIKTMGGRFSRELGIELSGSGDPAEVFKWFLAAKLFGARISSAIAMKTYEEFAARRIITAEMIIQTGWDGLVDILDRGGYVRYDFSTATKLLAIMADLIAHYGGDLNRLHAAAQNPKDLEKRLKKLGKGIGEVTVNIFLRELRDIWSKANPQPSALVRLAAGHLGLLQPGEKGLTALRTAWDKEKIPGRDFSDFEAALLRLGKDYCKKLKCINCPMQKTCRHKP